MNASDSKQSHQQNNPKKKKGPRDRKRLSTYASYNVTCLYCGFTFSGQMASCPKCKTLKGNLTPPS